MKEALLYIVAIIAVVVALFAFGIIGETADVADKEFGPRAALQKYEWFKETDASIKKMDSDIVLFRARVQSVKTRYEGYGSDMAKWPLDIRTTYNHELENATTDLVAVISQRNGIAREYKAASSKFNWAMFQMDENRPPVTYEEVLVE